MSAFSDLRKKLAELFQLDAAAELDFGIYRILNARRVEIEAFLDSLEPQVDAILAEALQSGGADLKAELEKVEAGLRAGGFDEAMIATAPKVRELREKIAESGSDPAALTHEIFSLLTTFFSRYYKDGDFISLRRYKKDTYAIPYEGEEVKLHWANADQYYIKSSESFRDYAFKLGPAPKDDQPDSRPSVTFKLVEADVEKDNNKAVAGQERRFVYQGSLGLRQPAAAFPGQPAGNGVPAAGCGGESGSRLPAVHEPLHLILHFAHLPVGKAKKQSELNAEAAEKILTEHAKGCFTTLAANDPTYTVKGKTRTILAKHLAEYTGKNSFDYFIHKDLGGFLRRELDFFIKNEVVHLDDLDDAPESNWREVRAKLKALRTIAGKIIRFLAQIEDFQKKLWLKKKFVTACDYVVTLDRIPEELYPEIAACDAQREEWVRLFAIDEIKGDLGRTGYSVPLTVEFLRENQSLPLDTSLVQKNLTANALSLMRNLSWAGITIHGSNSQALPFIASSYKGKVKCCTIDPPYNTGGGDFCYRDNFQHASWLAFMFDLLEKTRVLLQLEGSFYACIDDREVARLRTILDAIFGENNFLATIIWEKVFAPKPAAKTYSTSHDSILTYARNIDVWHRRLLPRTASQDAAYKNPDNDPRGPWASDNLLRNEHRDNGVYTIVSPSGKSWKPRPGTSWRHPEDEMKRLIETNQISFGSDGNAKPRRKKFLTDVQDGLVPETLWEYKEVGHTQDAKRQIIQFFGSDIFATPKPTALIEKTCRICCEQNDTILDFFAGSGTTGHAVINLNREDGGDRKYILIEMGEHFDTVLVPRLKKVIYSKDWKDGKPQSRNTGISHCFKILRLESYEDTLNNLRLHRSREQELALETFSPQAKEDYQLGYMLDLEARGSQSLLNVSAFTDPWNYTLAIASGTAGETKPTKVDLVETFHWLLGLTILAQGRGDGVHWTEGTNPDGEKVLVLWRNTSEVDAEALNAWCKKQKVSVLDGEFDLIYVNGDHHLENLRREDQTWKVRLTDEEFPKLMWEGCE
jgi:adenine-specific DNA-methyltransferase